MAELSVVSMAYLKVTWLNWRGSNVQWVKLLLLCMATVPCMYSVICAKIGSHYILRSLVDVFSTNLDAMVAIFGVNLDAYL